MRPELLAEHFLRACRALELPQTFEEYDLAEAFRQARGPGSVRMTVDRDTGLYAVRDASETGCGCGSQEPVEVPA